MATTLFTHKTGHGTLFQCPHCFGRFKQNKTRQRHLKRCHPDPDQPKEKEGLVDELETSKFNPSSYDDIGYHCSECNEWFAMKSFLMTHKKAHGPENTCTYPGCRASFKNKFTLNKHKKRVHIFTQVNGKFFNN
jgi:hypothetical protein